MKYNRYSGDIAVSITPDGAKMLFISGEPIHDSGLENCVQISLFSRENWWGNSLIDDLNQRIGSDFEKIRTIVDRQTINDYTESANRALQWMIDTGLAQKIEVSVTNPKGNYIQTSITIYPPGQDVQQLLLTKFGLNWISQSEFPSHERMKNL
jgi:phage gp46-like protein